MKKIIVPALLTSVVATGAYAQDVQSQINELKK